jgi:hypothetical protein
MRRREDWRWVDLDVRFSLAVVALDTEDGVSTRRLSQVGTVLLLFSHRDRVVEKAVLGASK